MNNEHLEVVREGTASIRAWRMRNSGVHFELPGASLENANLVEADLSYANLQNANLRNANLQNADLQDADLRDADLFEAKLPDANLSGADLRGAGLVYVVAWYTDLRGADLREALLDSAMLGHANLEEANLSRAALTDGKLREANLTRANLEGAVLRRADLWGADLRGADLQNADLVEADLQNAGLVGVNLARATMGWSLLDGSIARAAGLNQVNHSGPSLCNSDLLLAPDIPDVFLSGIGVPQMVIDQLPALRGELLRRHSCFISYAREDDVFAERLYSGLQARSVPVWKDSHDLPVGTWTRPVVFEQIRRLDKALLVLSEASMASDWVAAEVEEALAKEQHNPGMPTLFPLRIDEAVKTSNVAWARDLWNRRNIADFTAWEDPEAYASAFEVLLGFLTRPADS